jgi:hypothetical protein
MLRIALREYGLDLAEAQTAPNRVCVVSTITVDALGTAPWSAMFTLQRWNRIHQSQRFCGVVAVRACQLDREGHTASIADQVTLAAPLGPVGRIRTCLDPPKTARTEQLSTTALDQSICPPRESQFKSAK